MSGLQSLRKYSQVSAETMPADLEKCELCNLSVAHEHQHLIDPSTRKLICTCDGCSVLFDSKGLTKFKRVPRDIRRLTELVMPNESWEKLLVPINLAFFYRSSQAQRVVALYPSPAGVTESLLELEAWGEISDANPRLKELDEDIEGLLVNRLKGQQEYYIAPIDCCFELVGLLRMKWRGFTGGDRVWEEVQTFFTRLRERALS
jgi:hypothetical protein